MSRTTGSGQSRMRLAFYGRTNHTGEKAGTDMSRQYHACSAIATEFGAMTQWFYDAPHPLNVRDIESRLGTPRGGCRELTIRVADADREFDAIVCAALDRLPRQPRLRHPLLRAASTANAPFVFADDDLSLTWQLASNALVFSRLGLSCPEWPELR
jgi:DNA invertase Pin-like site-specific DNA recombinase